MPSILFVCTANRFRSPIAAACFKKELVVRHTEGGWKVMSAGTWTTDGLPATPGAISGARRIGLDISRHASRVITGQLMQEADLIIVMEEGQREALRSEFRQSAQKIHLLSEATSGSSYDIPDPAASMAGAEVPGEIDELIHSGFEKICALVGKS